MKKKYRKTATGILCQIGMDSYWTMKRSAIKDNIRELCDIPEMEGIENLIFELGLTVLADAFDDIRK